MIATAIIIPTQSKSKKMEHAVKTETPAVKQLVKAEIMAQSVVMEPRTSEAMFRAPSWVAVNCIG